MKGMSAFSQIKEDISYKLLVIALIVSVPGVVVSIIRIFNFGVTPPVSCGYFRFFCAIIFTYFPTSDKIFGSYFCSYFLGVAARHYIPPKLGTL